MYIRTSVQKKLLKTIPAPVRIVLRVAGQVRLFLPDPPGGPDDPLLLEGQAQHGGLVWRRQV